VDGTQIGQEGDRKNSTLFLGGFELRIISGRLITSRLGQAQRGTKNLGVELYGCEDLWQTLTGRVSIAYFLESLRRSTGGHLRGGKGGMGGTAWDSVLPVLLGGCTLPAHISSCRGQSIQRDLKLYRGMD